MAIHMGYLQTGVVCTHRFGLLDVIQIGRQSDPGFESVLTLTNTYFLPELCIYRFAAKNLNTPA